MVLKPSHPEELLTQKSSIWKLRTVSIREEGLALLFWMDSYCLSICSPVFLWNRDFTYIDLLLKWSHNAFFLTSRLHSSQTKLLPFGCPWLCNWYHDDLPHRGQGNFECKWGMRTNNPFVTWGLEQMGCMVEELACLVCAAGTWSIKQLEVFVNKCSLKLCMSLSIVSSTGSL